MRDLAAIKINVPCPVIDQDEIVSRAIHFCETQHDLIVAMAVPVVMSSALVCRYGLRACHPERSEAESKDPAELQSVVPRDSSTSLGMTEGRCQMTFRCYLSAVKNLGVWIVMALLGLTMQISFAGDYNSLVLQQIKQMPQGGRYSVSHFAKICLQRSAHFESGKFFILPSAASPSFCSGATYLVFIRTIEALRGRGELHLDYATLERLIIRDQRDREGIWGRWNANGPGTARLFHQLQLGRNFDNFDQAKPGDFMKIFWSRQVGKNEHGHSTIFLGTENRPDGQYVRYWSR